jgi:methionine-rich copper-binding protein CopC
MYKCLCRRPGIIANAEFHPAEVKIMKLAKLLLVPVLALAATLLRAHTGLAEANPADGAVLKEAPTALTLTYTAEVQLLKVDIATAAGLAQQSAFTPSATAAKTFSIPLPVLAPAAYEVSWTILGADGHRVEGVLGFTVDPTAAESAGTAAQDHSGH